MQMKSKVLGIIVVLLMLSMLTPMLAQAVPLKEKNNDKFQDFTEAGSYNALIYYSGADFISIPNMENVNKWIVSVNEEVMLTFEISIDGNTYELGKDFTYTGYSQEIFWDPVFNPVTGFPSSSRATHLVVNYMFDFSAVNGGIEGTLTMRAVSQGEHGSTITSLAGTGDLQNVQINAYISNVGNVGPIINFVHSGLVQGWPNISPNP